MLRRIPNGSAQLGWRRAGRRVYESNEGPHELRVEGEGHLLLRDNQSAGESTRTVEKRKGGLPGFPNPKKRATPGTTQGGNDLENLQSSGTKRKKRPPMQEECAELAKADKLTLTTRKKKNKSAAKRNDSKKGKNGTVYLIAMRAWHLSRTSGCRGNGSQPAQGSCISFPSDPEENEEPKWAHAPGQKRNRRSRGKKAELPTSEERNRRYLASL